MKILLSTLVFLLSFTLCNAQFSDNSETTKSIFKKFFVGGSLNYTASKNVNGLFFNTGNQNRESTRKSINTAVGYQLNSNWILGGNFLLQRENIESRDGPSNERVESLNSNSFGLFSRYLFNPDNKLTTFLSPYFRISNSERTFDAVNSFFNNFMSEEKSTTLGVSLGAQYDFTTWLRATTSIGGYAYTSGTITVIEGDLIEENDFNTSGFNISSSNIFFGLEFLF